MNYLGRIARSTHAYSAVAYTAGQICGKQIACPCLSNFIAVRGVYQKILHRERIRNQQVETLEAEEKEAELLRKKIQEAILKEQHIEAEIPADLDVKNMPAWGMQSPYEKPEKRCILCEHSIEPDYKNTRLLSQYISPHTGRIYGRQITGLCLFMQRRISQLIKRSREFGLMPYHNKQPQYLEDPKLYNPFSRHGSR